MSDADATLALSGARIRRAGALGRWRSAWPWLAALALAVVPPWMFFDWSRGRHDSFVEALLTQMAIMSIFALSFNMLMGQTGLLSFGHAVFLGLPAYVTIDLMDAIGHGSIRLPEELLQLIGGLAGLFFAALFGYAVTKQRATAFAMITFGLGELVTAAAVMFNGFFGGEGGITGNRMLKSSLFGLSSGPPIHVYYLALAWTATAVMLMRLLMQAPLGPWPMPAVTITSAQFVGYDPRVVRFCQFALSGFFAGIAVALYALTYEIVTYDAVSSVMSANALIMTFIGGIGAFWGPIAGVVLVTVMQSWVSLISNAWQIYVGALFIIMVMFAPGGIAGLTLLHRPLWQAGRMRMLAVPYLRLALPVAVAIAGFVGLVELCSFVTIGTHRGKALHMFGGAFDPASPQPWAAAAALLLIGGAIAQSQMRAFAARWAAITEEIKAA